MRTIMISLEICDAGNVYILLCQMDPYNVYIVWSQASYSIVISNNKLKVPPMHLGKYGHIVQNSLGMAIWATHLNGMLSF